MENNENDFSFLELPFEYFKEKVFVSTIYTKEKVNPSLKVGVNICLLNRKVSKNIILFKAYFLRKENSYKRQSCLKKRKGGRFYGKNDASTKEKTKIKSAWI